MNYYILGIVFGVFIALSIAGIAWLINKKRYPNSGKYDERQIAARGKAFQAGFFTTLVAAAAVSIWDYVGTLPGEAFLWHIGSLLFGVLVYAVTAVHYDAYVGMYDNPSRFVKIGLILVLAMGLSGLVNLNTGRPESSVIAFLDLFIAVMWVVIIAALLIHQRAKKEDEE